MKSTKQNKQITKKKPLKKVKPINGLDTKKVSKTIKKVETTDYNPITKKKGWFDFSAYWRILKSRLSPQKTYLINMELRNGYHQLMTISCGKESFRYQGSEYVIDNDMMYYVISAGCNCLDYHQDLSIPIKRTVPLNDIKKTITSMKSSEVETAINPQTLRMFIESEVIQKVMQGQAMGNMLKNLVIICALGCIASVCHLLIYMSKSGMFDSIKGII